MKFQIRRTSQGATSAEAPHEDAELEVKHLGRHYWTLHLNDLAELLELTELDFNGEILVSLEGDLKNLPCIEIVDAYRGA